MMARITDALRTVSQSLGSRRRIAEGLLVPLISVLLALATVAIILLIVGANPLTAYASMINAAFGSPYAVSATIIKAMPRLLAALGIAIAIRANLWNIGAEGQIYIGGTAAAGMVLALPALPQPLVPIVAIIAGGLAGAAWLTWRLRSPRRRHSRTPGASRSGFRVLRRLRRTCQRSR